MDDTRRDDLITGLYALAGYLTAHPDMPVPDEYTRIAITIHATGTDADKRAEVDRIAQLLGVPVTDETADHGHYYAERAFGPIAYGAIGILSDAIRRYNAGQSYADSVIPDPAPAVTQ
jgi:hypothetical protein